MTSYRTPGNDEFVGALGWAVWNFLYLEEKIVRWLWLLKPDESLTDWRRLTAYEKGVALGRVAKASSLDPSLFGDLQDWLRRYEAMVLEIRNGVVHAHAYTVGGGGDEPWVPGLAYISSTGERHDIARSPEELHQIAFSIEAIMLELGSLESRLRASDGQPELGTSTEI